jgi:hypothetical protein
VIRALARAVAVHGARERAPTWRQHEFWSSGRKLCPNRSALQKLKHNFFVPIIGFYGLLVFPANVLHAINTGQIEYANRFRPNVMISYHDHPSAFIFTMVVSVVSIPFCLGLLYAYFFAKIPE